MELWPPPPIRTHAIRRYPEIVVVKGWKGSQGGILESRALSGAPTLTYLC
jgi:hypothetical protein